MIRYWIIIVLVSIGVLLQGCSGGSENSNGSNPEAIHANLQRIENKVLREIALGDKGAALILLDSLIHPSTDNGFITTHFKSYSEFWADKRESLRDKIMEIESPHVTIEETSNVGEDNSINNTPIDSVTQSETIIADVNFKSELLGLYAILYPGGNSQFYKFYKNEGDSFTSALFQSTIDGEVKTIRYRLQSFDSETNSVVLQGTQDNSNAVLKFSSYAESENGYQLVDNEGLEYSFVSK